MQFGFRQCQSTELTIFYATDTRILLKTSRLHFPVKCFDTLNQGSSNYGTSLVFHGESQVIDLGISKAFNGIMAGNRPSYSLTTSKLLLMAAKPVPSINGKYISRLYLEEKFLE